MRSVRSTVKSANHTEKYSRSVLVETSRGAMAADIVWTADSIAFADPATAEPLRASAYRPNCQIVPDYGGVTAIKDIPTEMRVQSYVFFPFTGAPATERYFLTHGRVPRSGIYPSSAEGSSWYERMIYGDTKCSFFLQRIEGGNRLWLTVLDSTNKQVLAAHPVKPHEFASIWMREDTEVSREEWEHVGPEDAEAARRQILSILDEPRPNDLSRFWMVIRGADILHAIGPTMRDLVEPLVPESLAEDSDIRNEFKAFLAMTILRDPLDADPVDSSNALLPTRTLRGLYAAHLRHRLDGEDTPPYVRVFLDAASRRLQIQESTSQEPLRPHEVAWLHITENSPDWTSRALKYCSRPNDHAQPLTRLPVTREQAAADIELRKDRAALMYAGYSLRTVVDTEAIGLEQVLFRGNAHTWPHRHLAWLAVLRTPTDISSKRSQYRTREKPSKRPPTLQFLLLPSEALQDLHDKIDKSTEQNWRRIDWRTRSFNPELYDSRISRWTAPFWNLAKSEIPELSLNRLRGRLGPEAPPNHVALDRFSARALDLTSSQFYLDMLESERFLRDYRIDLNALESSLQELWKARVISVQHVIKMTPLPSMAIELHGEEKAVCGFTWAIMQGTPAASTWVSDSGKGSLMLTYLPHPFLHSVSKHAFEMADRLNIECTVDEVASYSAYLNDMYQRLLRRTDNRWDADISDLLSQFSFADSPRAVR